MAKKRKIQQSISFRKSQKIAKTQLTFKQKEDKAKDQKISKIEKKTRKKCPLQLEISNNSTINIIDQQYINSYLQLNECWQSRCVIIIRNNLKLQVINGNFGQNPNWQSSVSEFQNEIESILCFKSEIQKYLSLKYELLDQQFFNKLQEFNVYLNNSIMLQSNKVQHTQQKCVDILFDQSNILHSKAYAYRNHQENLGKAGCYMNNLLKAELFDTDTNINGWLGSEKLDGVRAIWTGSNLYSRNGYRFNSPSFFTKLFPQITLEGELFTKRDDFKRCISIIENKNRKNNLQTFDLWKEVTFCVFDAPHLNKPFKERIGIIQQQISKVNSQFIRCIPHFVIQNRSHIYDQLDKILDRKGEGVILRNPESFYDNKLSKIFFEVKIFMNQDAEVIGQQIEDTQLTNSMISLYCRLKNNVEFSIEYGFNEETRRSPPKIGSIIIFKYLEFSEDGRPLNPIFLRKQHLEKVQQIVEKKKTIVFIPV